MDSQPAPTSDVSSDVRDEPAGKRPSGPWLAIVRVAWAMVTVLALGLFVASVPTLYAQLSNPDEAVRVGLAQLGISANSYAAYRTGFAVVLVLGYCAVAAVIFWRKSHDWMTLFVSLFLVTFGVTNALGLAGLREAPKLPYEFLNFVSWTSAPIFFYLFPDGRFVPSWTRPLAVILIALQVPSSFSALSFSLDPWRPIFDPSIALVVWGSSVFAQIYRYRRVSDQVARQQTKWLVFGFTAAFTIVFVFSLPSIFSSSLGQPGSLYELGITTGLFVSCLLIPLSVAMAILKYRLYDIDIIINRTLVYGALTACVVGVYVLVVGYLGALFQARGSLMISLVATGVVAVLFAPLRHRLQRGVNRLMYGERDEPYAVLSRLGQRLEGTISPGAVLSTVVETVAEALKVPYAAITLRQDEDFATAAEHGKVVDGLVVLPLVYQHETVGQLLLAPRAGENDFSPTDRRLLDDLARQAGIAVHAVRLTADLQRSRERLVTAREEERRRLRRDLHDGLGPTLGSLPLKLDVAGDLMERDPAAARELLRGLKFQARSAVADIRRLVYELRPPALDDLGMAGAIREAAAQYGTSGLRVSVHAPETLPPLPAAVEVAVYRVAQEALNNVARHAAASECVVRLVLDEKTGTLRLEIEDDGRGIGEERGQGVGLHSMRERAAELGGECVVEPGSAGGTRVRAFLPLAGSKAER